MLKPKHFGNLYNNVQIDIEQAHQNFERKALTRNKRNPLYFTAALIKLGIWKRLIDSGLIRVWFDEFNNYWINCLGCRPLRIHDFFWLYSHYRTMFGAVEVKNGANSREFMKSWQLYENIFLTFQAVYTYAIFPLDTFFYRKYFKKAKNILEYGCGIAPITYSALKFGNYRKKSFYISDIRGFTYHFAKWRLASYRNVSFIDVKPDHLAEFDVKFDLIFITKVLEHLTNPLQIIEHLCDNMEKGSYLIFDYIKSEGKGLDTIEALEERESVLNYIERNFELIKGKIDKKNSIGITIVRKKRSR